MALRVYAPYATSYEWGYLHEALEVDGANRAEFLFTPSIDQDIHAVFLKQISESDSASVHVVIADQAGFHLKNGDSRVPENVRLLPLPPYSPELNPVEPERSGDSQPKAARRASAARQKLGDQIKDVVCNKLYPKLRKLEDRIVAELRGWMNYPKRVASLIGEGWLLDCVNAGERT